MKAHQRLQKVLTALATDQKEIAKKIGKHEVSVSRMVNGVMDPSFDTLVALKKSYPMININYLVSGEGPMFMSGSDMNYANEDQAGYGSPAMEKILKEFTEVNGALLDFLKANTTPKSSQYKK
jgi:predicted transcriptional regulator